MASTGGSAFTAMLARDLRLAFRRRGETLNPIVFFLIVTTLFPLSLSPQVSQLRDVGTGVLWVAALLSSLLALDGLFRTDLEDGSLEQIVLSPHSLSALVLAKVLAHWMVSGLPLLIVSPLVASAFFLPGESLGTLLLALLLATPTLSLLGAIGAALTASVRRGRGIIGLLILPLAMPVLIFGARATELAVLGDEPAGPLYALAALFMLALSLAPFAAAAALRISVE